MDILPHPFLVNFTKPILQIAASTLDIDYKSSDSKATIMYKLNCHDDTDEMVRAVNEAAGAET